MLRRNPGLNADDTSRGCFEERSTKRKLTLIPNFTSLKPSFCDAKTGIFSTGNYRNYLGPLKS